MVQNCVNDGSSYLLYDFYMNFSILVRCSGYVITFVRWIGIADIHQVIQMCFESTFTNIINRANFAIPVTDVSSPSTFGVLTSVQSSNNAGNRTGQGALRVDF
jgi:hypothetical protein